MPFMRIQLFAGVAFCRTLSPMEKDDTHTNQCWRVCAD